MRILIIEDESSNSKRLIKLLNKITTDAEIIDCLTSVEESLNWFEENPEPDLIFMDIQLSDGLCFEILSNKKIESPIIFTTAYDEYALQAFKHNSIDYLLKPVEPVELEKAILKYNRLYKEKTTISNGITNVIKTFNESIQYKNRFLVRTGKHFVSVPVENISFFIIENQLVFIYTRTGDKYILDLYLDDLEKTLNPEIFFRINRQSLVHIDAIDKIYAYAGGRLLLKIIPSIPQKEFIVSREKVNSFKEWLNR